MSAFAFLRSPRAAVTIAAIAAAFTTGWLLPVPAALAADEHGAAALFSALAAAGIVALMMAPLHAVRGGRTRGVAIAITATGLLAGLAAFTVGGYARRTCTANYGERPVIIGTELTATGLAYRQANPELSNDELLFDAAGNVDRVWSARSVGRCRTLVASTYFLWMPLLVAGLAAAVHAVAAGGLTSLPSRGAPAATARAPASLRYDVFISYRHGGADTDVARELLEQLDRAGYKVAIDERDFAANASFLMEMERCIRESRFTLAIVSPRYLESGNCEEEAIVCRVLDLGDRKRRLIPFVIQPVEMPAWLYTIVGIDCTKQNPLVEPLDKLKATLGPPANL